MELPPAALPLLIKAETVVQQQLKAYNARDWEGWLATYKVDAEQYLLHAGLLASGHDAIRRRMTDRFQRSRVACPVGIAYCHGQHCH